MTQSKPIADDWIAYVGPFDFPIGGAAAQRVLGISQSLRDAGYRMTVVSGYLSANRVAGQPVHVEQCIESVQVKERSAEHLPKWLRFARYFTIGHRSRDWFEQQPQWPTAIIIYSGYSPYLIAFTRWANKRGIKIIFDAVEWYAAESWLGLVTSPYLLNIELAMRYLIPKTDGVICISRALENYYAKRQVPTIRVPPTLNMLPGLPAAPTADSSAITTQTSIPKSSAQRADQQAIKLVYAGSPGKKDRLDKVATGVKYCNVQQPINGQDPSQRKLELHIIGMNELEFIQYMEQSSESGIWQQNTLITTGIVCHGQMPHTEVMKLLKQAHYSIFIREVNRVTTFGLPTKYVESVACGCPVIANITSDLGQFHHDKTGIVVPSTNFSDLQASLAQAMSFTETEYRTLREQAQLVASKYFDVVHYAMPLKKFIENLT